MEKSEYDLGARELWRTRANIAELIGARLLKWYTEKELVNALFFEFVPTQSGPHTPEAETALDGGDAYGLSEDDDDFLDPNEVWPESAMSLAIDTHSIRFTHHPLVQRAVDQIWRGRILLVREEIAADPQAATAADENLSLLFAASSRMSHRYLFTEGGEGTIVTTLKTPKTLPSRRKAARDMLSFANLFDVSKLRIPLYQYVIRLSFMAVFLVVYTLVVFDRPLAPDSLEWSLLVLTLAYLADEFKAAVDGGIKIYLSSLWNWLDIGSLALILAFYGTRWAGLALDRADLRELAFNLLACANAFLWPRAFAALDRIRFLGVLLIVCKHMVASAGLFFLLMLVNLIGFTQGLFAVSRGNADPNNTEEPWSWWGILYELTLTYIGFYWRALDLAVELEPVFGQILVVAFLSITNLILLNLLISIFAQSFSSVLDNADAEFEFSLALHIVEHALADDVFPYLPPLNLIELSVAPLQYVLPRNIFLRANRVLLQIVCSPILLVIWIAELWSIFRMTDEDWEQDLEEQQWLQNPTDTEGWEDPETGERRSASLDVPREHSRTQTANSMDRVTVLPVRKSGSAIRFADEVDYEENENEAGVDDSEESERTEIDDLKAMLATLIRETRSINSRLAKLESKIAVPHDAQPRDEAD